MNRKGSILIFMIWILLLLALFAASVGSRARLGIKLSSFHNQHFQNAYRLHSAVNLAAYFINEDEDPDNDSMADSWYNTSQGFKDAALSKEVTITITDEESKININEVDRADLTHAPILTKFFEVLGQEGVKNGVKLRAKAKDIIAGIVDRRGGTYESGKPVIGIGAKKGKLFETIDELRLIESMTPEDFETLKPFFTVYGDSNFAQTWYGNTSPVYVGYGVNTFRVNINTVHDWILKAIIDSLGIDFDAEKKFLYERILLVRKGDPRNPLIPPAIFEATDLTPPASGFIKKLWPVESQDPKFSPPQVIKGMIFRLVGYFTTDSKFFSVHVETKKKNSLPSESVEAILGLRKQVILVKQSGNYFPVGLPDNVLRGRAGYGSTYPSYPYEILYWKEQAVR